MSVVINSISGLRPEDDTFVVIYNEDQIVSMSAPVPTDLSKYATRTELFLAGVAFARLGGLVPMYSKVVSVQSEEL